MDLSDLQTTNSTGSQSSDTVNNSSMMTPSKRDIFLSTYRRQNFTFPNSVMHYIAKNPKNAKVYKKMVERCKYFFIKNPILIISKLRYYLNGWTTYVNETWKNIDISTISCKLWITDELWVVPENVNNNSLASSIIPKLYQCDFDRLALYDQVISYYEFVFLCSYVKDLKLIRVNVKKDDGTEVACEKLIKQLPQLKRIYYSFANPSNNTSKNTLKEIWKIPHLSNYDSFVLDDIPGNVDADIDSFYFFMKRNKKTSVRLDFSGQISEESKTRLEAIIDEIIGTKNHGYKPPYIAFPGLADEKCNQMYHIFIK